MISAPYRRLLTGMCLLGLVAMGVAPPAAAAPPGPGASTVVSPGLVKKTPPAESAESLASREAKRTGKPVVVDPLTTPTEKVVASPDGKFTKTLTVEPSRMLVNGGWEDLSTDLVDSGTVFKPRMAPVALTIGKGKTAHMSSVADNQGHSVTESWPYGNLPVPTIKKNTATYADVLPGVDLILVARKQGISQVLKISTPAAAHDPKVLGLKLKLDAANVAFEEDGDGGLTGKSLKTGEDVLRSAAGRWWDSRYDGASPTDPGGPGITGNLDLSLVRDAAGVHEKLGIADVIQTKDLTFPVYIDPDWSAVRASYLYVDTAFPTTSYWNGQFTDGFVNVGYLPAKWDYSYGKNHTARGYWQFSTSPMAGKKIFAARFNATNVWSSSCTARIVRAKITGGVGPGTTWNAQPGIAQVIEAKAFAYGNEGAGCGDSTVGFDMAAASDIFPTVSQWTVGLFADNETWDELSWKRFSNDASIIVTYGTPPNTPQVTALSGCGYKCPGSGQQPGITRISNPAFTVSASDPDATADGDIRVYMSLFKSTGEVVWTTATPFLVPSGSDVNWGAGNGRADLADGNYTFQTQVSDPTGLVSPVASYTFAVDTTAPAAPTITTSDAASKFSDGKVGETQFNFDLTNTEIDPVKGFIYAVTGDNIEPSYPADMSCGQRSQVYTMICPADGKWASIDVAAISKANTRITAWSVDEAGNIGTLKKTAKDADSNTAFNVGNYAPMPATRLPVTTSGTATALMIPAGTAGPTGSCSDIADTSVPSGFKRPALGLQGGYATTATSAADTGDSFTVSGWFCPSVVTANAKQPVIAQIDSAGTILAELRISTTGLWQFATRTTSGSTESISTGTAVTKDSWYFVNAVYDSVNRQLRITTSNANDTAQWVVGTTSATHAAVPSGTKVLLGASSMTAGTPRFQGLLAAPTLTTGVLVRDQIRSLWTPANQTTVTVLK